MAVVIIHDFIPYVPPKPPAVLPQPEETDIGKYLNVDDNVDLVYSAVENELPTPTAGDNGKFVGVDDSKYKIVNSPLPTVTTDDNGDVLTVVEGVWTKANAPGGLPTTTTGDKYKSLKVGSNGQWGVDYIINVVSAGNLSDWTATLSNFNLVDTALNVVRNTVITVEFRNMSTMSRTIYDFVYSSNVNSSSGRFQCICSESDGVYLRYFDVNLNSTSQSNVSITSVKLN